MNEHCAEIVTIYMYKCMPEHCEEIVTVHVYILVYLFRFVKIIVHSLILVLLFSSYASILAETMIIRTWSFHFILISCVLFTYCHIVFLLLHCKKDKPFEQLKECCNSTPMPHACGHRNGNILYHFQCLSFIASFIFAIVLFSYTESAFLS